MKSRRHRRRRWYTAAGGTIAGVAGLAALTAATNVAIPAGAQLPRPDPNRVSGQAGHGSKDGIASDESPARGEEHARATPPDSQSANQDSHADEQNAHAEEQRGTADAGRHSEGVEVPCDPAELAQAILAANAHGGDTLDLADHCTYSLLQHEGVNGLPIITQPITINGHYATIERNAAADPFRIFNVDVGGKLILRDVTVRGGLQDLLLSPGGGGMLVRAGGQATVEHSRFLDNRSLSDGGAIANFGITEIVGGPQEHSADVRAKDGNDRASEISRNSARNSGGGVYTAGYLTVDHTRLSYNTTNLGGGLSNIGGVALLRSCQVDDNHSAVVGGGIENTDVALTQLDTCAVTDNISDGNGGGIDNTDSQLFLRHTVVRNNQGSPNGGGIQNEGTLVADDSWIVANTAANAGGGVRNSGSDADAVLRNSHVDLNQTLNPDSFGAGIANAQGRVRLVKANVTKNTSALPAGGVDSEDPAGVAVDDESQIVRNAPTNCTPGIPNCFN